MFFNNSIQRERGVKFEEWQRLTDQALRRPGVQQKLGALGAQLIQLNEDAFLPNVRHSAVRVPRDYSHTDRIGILPYLDSDHDLRPHDTLLQPTPTRRERIRSALGEASLDNSNRALNGFIRHAIAQIPEEEKAAFVNPRRDASGGAPSHYDSDTGILLSSRPLVAVRWGAIPWLPIIRGVPGAHELTHAVDVEELSGMPDTAYLARTELRGYRVGAIIAEDLIKSGDLRDWMFQWHDTTTDKVEAVRRDYEIDSDVLLNGDFQINEDDSIVLAMMMTGVLGSEDGM